MFYLLGGGSWAGLPCQAWSLSATVNWANPQAQSKNEEQNVQQTMKKVQKSMKNIQRNMKNAQKSKKNVQKSKKYE